MVSKSSDFASSREFDSPTNRSLDRSGAVLLLVKPASVRRQRPERQNRASNSSSQAGLPSTPGSDSRHLPLMSHVSLRYYTQNARLFRRIYFKEGHLMARLVSINVGLPRDVPWRGEKVHTAIWKQPVQGRTAVGRLNVEGDGQGDLAGHGGEHRAVMVYQMDAYRYWEAQLGRNDFSFGQFGENFTVV